MKCLSMCFHKAMNILIGYKAILTNWNHLPFINNKFKCFETNLKHVYQDQLLSTHHTQP